MVETIFAPATGAGQSAITVVRITGPRSHDLISDLCGDVPPMRQLVLRTLRDAGGVLDQAMVVVFPEGASFTGERMAEIHCHGGAAVVSAVLDALARPGCRLAEPGEFTRRAVMAGRMDLTQAEGIGDLIAAETALQRDAALRAMSGGVSDVTEGWRKDLIHARALVEATIDWADEEVPEDVSPEVARLLDGLLEGIDRELSDAARAARLRSGLEVAIVGPPNAGKSTLLNAIAGRPVAIVSELAGTTRDVLEVRCDLGGLPVTFLDTAGLRETADRIEAEGVRRARDRARGADLRLHLSAPDCEASDRDLWQAGDIDVWAKADLGSGTAEISISDRAPGTVSALLDLVEARLRDRVSAEGVLGVERRREAAVRSRAGIADAKQALAAGEIEIAAEHLRQATTALDRLDGRLAVEDVLEQVFGMFCLGK